MSGSFLPIYSICVVKKSSHGKKVYEKLGFYSKNSKLLNINPFRLAFWVSKNVSFSGNCLQLLVKHRIFQQHE